jgi:hypothetical protein
MFLFMFLFIFILLKGSYALINATLGPAFVRVYNYDFVVSDKFGMEEVNTSLLMLLLFFFFYYYVLICLFFKN